MGKNINMSDILVEALTASSEAKEISGKAKIRFSTMTCDLCDLYILDNYFIDMYKKIDEVIYFIENGYYKPDDAIAFKEIKRLSLSTGYYITCDFDKSQNKILYTYSEQAISPIISSYNLYFIVEFAFRHIVREYNKAKFEHLIKINNIIKKSDFFNKAIANVKFGAEFGTLGILNGIIKDNNKEIEDLKEEVSDSDYILRESLLDEVREDSEVVESTSKLFYKEMINLERT